MTVVIKKGEDPKKVQNKIQDFLDMKEREKQLRKEKIIEATFGKIIFDKSKSPEAIQRELRDEWN
jgi:hypothetical protein